MKIDLKELGKRIKLTRKGQDLTQEMLAEKVPSSFFMLYSLITMNLSVMKINTILTVPSTISTMPSANTSIFLAITNKTSVKMFSFWWLIII